MSEWLLLSGDEMRARQALATAQGVLEEDPKTQPFVQALIRRDLELLVDSLRHQPESQLDTDEIR
jgi:hypothetical protein